MCESLLHNDFEIVTWSLAVPDKSAELPKGQVQHSNQWPFDYFFMVFQKRILVGCARKHKKRYRCQNCTTPSIKIMGSEEKNYATDRFGFLPHLRYRGSWTEYQRNIGSTADDYVTGLIRTTGRYGYGKTLLDRKYRFCLLYIVYNIIYNNILVCKCTICINYAA